MMDAMGCNFERGLRRLQSHLWVRGATVGLLVLALAWFVLPKPSLYPGGLVFSRAREDRTGKIVHLGLTPDGKYRLRTSLSDISPELIRATLALEDQHFRSHPGVNLLSLLRAGWGVLSGQRLGGGSTITMQYARLRWKLRTTALWGKTMQMARAMQLERHFTKDEILEAYFNLAPYGGNVEGVSAASLLWCGRPCAGLSLRESVALAVLPQSPTKRRPNQATANESHRAAMRRLWLRLGERSDPLNDAYSLRPELGVPREVPHLARRLFNERPASEVVTCAIDLPKQHIVESVLQQFIEQRREVGINNGCAILVHALTREVLAYVGSADFSNVSIQGQVDGIKARRSPGSALKPFVYALAMAQGLIHPRSLVRDGKLSYADYNPENFDREFMGPIPASEALFRSRNIPAIALAEKLAAPGLYGFLLQAGVKLPKSESHYGLSLPLGGAEVSPEELVALYAMLGDDGTMRTLRFETKPPRGDAPLLLGAEARFLTREMLRGPEHEAIAWKTGTSHGFRDAWCAGMLGDYVLVVWLGHFDGRGNGALVARKSAAPLLFQMFERLGLPAHESQPPKNIERVKLCAVSGELPTASCKHCVTDWFIPGVSPIKSCTLHRDVLVEAATGLRITCDDGTRTIRHEVHEFWPPDMLALFREAGLPRREPPAWSQDERPTDGGKGPRIVSPITKRTYTMSASQGSRKSIPLRAETSAGVQQVFWFAGEQYLGSSKPVEAFSWSPTPGDWQIQALDDHGRSATCSVKVEKVP